MAFVLAAALSAGCAEGPDRPPVLVTLATAVESITLNVSAVTIDGFAYADAFDVTPEKRVSVPVYEAEASYIVTVVEPASRQNVTRVMESTACAGVLTLPVTWTASRALQAADVFCEPRRTQ